MVILVNTLAAVVIILVADGTCSGGSMNVCLYQIRLSKYLHVGGQLVPGHMSSRHGQGGEGAGGLHCGDRPHDAGDDDGDDYDNNIFPFDLYFRILNTSLG